MRTISSLVILVALAGVILVAPPVRASAQGNDKPLPIRLGAIFSLSGWGAEGGQSELDGARLAVDEINRKGGHEGRPVELIVEDNGSDLTKTASSFQKLATIDRVSVVIGPNWVEFFQIASPLAKRMRVPLVSASGGGTTAGRGWAFTLWPPPAVAVSPLAEAMASRAITRVALLISENAYYQGIADALASELRKRGIAIVTTERYNPGHSDFRSTLASLRRRNIDGIVALLLESGDFASFLKQRIALKVTIPVFGANTVPFDQTLQKDLTPAEGLTFFDYVRDETPTFDREFLSRYGHAPGFASAKAYDTVYLVLDARTRCRDEVRREETGLDEQAALAQCLAKTHYRGISGDISFDEDGVIEARRANTRLFQVRRGAITPYEIIGREITEPPSNVE